MFPHLQEILELPFTSGHLTTESKDFLFILFHAVPPHQHLWLDPVSNLVRNQALDTVVPNTSTKQEEKVTVVPSTQSSRAMNK